MRAGVEISEHIWSGVEKEREKKSENQKQILIMFKVMPDQEEDVKSVRKWLDKRAGQDEDWKHENIQEHENWLELS